MPRKAGGGRRARKANAQKIQIGNKTFTKDKDVKEIDDSTPLFLSGDFESLRYKLATDGYLFIRGVIPKNEVAKAREMMLKQASKDGSVINTNETPYSMARIGKKHELRFICQTINQVYIISNNFFSSFFQANESVLFSLSLASNGVATINTKQKSPKKKTNNVCKM